MASFNKVILMGNLVADPELRTTQSGLNICKFTIAVNRVYNTQEGEKREEVSYVDIDTFGKQAETVSKYMSKGRPILVEGRLKQDRWEDKDGNKRSKLVVSLERFSFVGSRADNESSGSSGFDSAPPARRTEKAATNSGADLDEEVPF